MPADSDARSTHLRWLLELTSIPTAAGREHRVIAWLERWVAERPALQLRRDAAGNLIIERRDAPAPGAIPPRALTLLTAHLDHPAFVVERIVAPAVVEASFRGGVMAPYFENARVALHTANGPRIPGRVVESREASPFRLCVIELDEHESSAAAPAHLGDILTWDLPPANIENDRLLRAPACDDLAAVAAAVAALDQLIAHHPAANVAALFTRAEEIGFVGAIAACRLGTIPAGARVMALENSRAFADSPIGAGPIVRVGDRMSTFSPTLTRAIARLAERLAGESEKAKPNPEEDGGKQRGRPDEEQPSHARPPRPFRWQRKLMPGGACEATAFCAYGHDATCLCLPLGNYHNMSEIDRVQAAQAAGEKTPPALIAPEFISIDDYHDLIDLLIACGSRLEEAEPIIDRLEKMHAERAFVLEDHAPTAS